MRNKIQHPVDIFDKLPQDHDTYKKFISQRFYPGIQIERSIFKREIYKHRENDPRVVKSNQGPFINMIISDTITPYVDYALNSITNNTLHVEQSLEVSDECEKLFDGNKIASCEITNNESYDIIGVDLHDYFFDTSDCRNNENAIIRKIRKGLTDDLTKLSYLQEILYLAQKMLQSRAADILFYELGLSGPQFRLELYKFLTHKSPSKLRKYLLDEVKEARKERTRIKSERKKIEKEKDLIKRKALIEELKEQKRINAVNRKLEIERQKADAEARRLENLRKKRERIHTIITTHTEPAPGYELVEVIEENKEIIEIWENERGTLKELHKSKLTGRIKSYTGRKQKAKTTKQFYQEKIETQKKKKSSNSVSLAEYQRRVQKRKETEFKQHLAFLKKQEKELKFTIKKAKNNYAHWKTWKQETIYNSLLERFDETKIKSTLGFSKEAICYIWSWIDIPKDDFDCWIWNGDIFDDNSDIKGEGKYVHENKTNYVVIRLIHLMFYGEQSLLPDQKIYRMCQNIRCCNPNHLVL